MPATAIAALDALAHVAPGTAPAMIARDLGGERLQLLGRRRVVVQVALGLAHDAGLRRDVEGDLAVAADDELRRAAADVDDDGLARRRAARSLVAPANVSAASSSPPIVRASSAEALAHARR